MAKASDSRLLPFSVYPGNVRSGSKAELTARKSDFRFTPERGLRDGVIGRSSLWIAEDFGCCASG